MSCFTSLFGYGNLLELLYGGWVGCLQLVWCLCVVVACLCCRLMLVIYDVNSVDLFRLHLKLNRLVGCFWYWSAVSGQLLACIVVLLLSELCVLVIVFFYLFGSLYGLVVSFSC